MQSPRRTTDRNRASRRWLGWVGCAALLLGVSCADAPSPEPLRAGRVDDGGRRVLVIGWDGATFDLIDPLVAAGRLPHFERLARRGVSATLESTVVPISSAAWTAAVTGVGPGANGVYSFFEPVDKSYDVRLVSAHSNRATPIWRLLGRLGYSSVVWGVPVTYPPEPINGVLVAGMLSPLDAAYAHPSELTNELRATGFVPDLGMWQRRNRCAAARRFASSSGSSATRC